jgi:diacylglycerol O-acyltransferase
MHQLTGLDASFLYLETPNAPMHIGAIAVYDPSTAPGGFVRFKDILTTIESRLHLARSFRERVVRVPFDLDHPYWINDPDFDLEFHVRHIALPQPGDWRQLCIQAARLHSRPLDLTKPLWEFTVVEGLDNVQGLPEGAFAVVSKVHHAAIDGVSGAEITNVIHDSTPEPNVEPPSRPWVADREPLNLELFARTYANNLRQPFRTARVLARSVEPLARVTAGIARRELRTAGVVPRTRFNAPVSPHRVVDGLSLKLDAVRAIKASVEGATVNDAVLAVVGGGLRKYLQAKDELPGDSMIAMAPVSVRGKDQSGAMGNQISAMLVSLGTHIEDPLTRLRAVNAGTQDSKKLTESIGAKLLSDYSQLYPAALAGLAARMYSRFQLANRVRPAFNCVVTNVPGPRQPLYSGGARLVTQYGTGPVVDGMGLIIPVFSYCGEITISFTSCRDMIPDPAFFAECLRASYEALEEAALGQQLAPSAVPGTAIPPAAAG